jgi:hypothetical protein
MPFRIFHFRDSDHVLRRKHMVQDVQRTLKYLDSVLYGSPHRRELLRDVLQEGGWRENGNLNFLENRRYQFKGFKNGIALEANLNSYEYLLEGLFRLQVAFDKLLIDAGILFLTAKRSENSPYGDSAKMVGEDVQALYPTIYLPVSIILFDMGDQKSVKEPKTTNVLQLPSQNQFKEAS